MFQSENVRTLRLQLRETERELEQVRRELREERARRERAVNDAMSAWQFAKYLQLTPHDREK